MTGRVARGSTLEESNSVPRWQLGDHTVDQNDERVVVVVFDRCP